MSQARPFQSIASDTQQLGRLDIGKVSSLSANSLLQRFQIRTIGQHLGIVVAFDHDGVERLHDGDKTVKRVTEIRQDAESLGSVIDYECDTIHGVMRRRDRLDCNISEPERGTRCKVSNVIEWSKLVLLARHSQRPLGDVDRQPEFPLINAQTTAVVAMVVRNHEGVNVFDVATVGGKSGLSLPAADPGVEQKPDATGFDINAVAVASGLQGDDFHYDIVPRTTIHVALVKYDPEFAFGSPSLFTIVVLPIAIDDRLHRT